MFTKFYGIGSLPPECQQLIKKYSFFFFLTNFCVLFVYAFIILYLIDLFGVFTGGFLFSILLFVSFLFDFVTGVISDRIGQKNILLLSISCSISFYYLLSVFQSFNEIFLIMVIGGIGVALRSGALETWFFNNYKMLVSDADPE